MQFIEDEGDETLLHHELGDRSNTEETNSGFLSTHKTHEADVKRSQLTEV